MPASTIDLTAGLDPTAYTAIDGAQLLDLVANGTPYTDKGLVILTTDIASNPDVPDAATTTKWKRYIWVRQSSTSSIPYVWNDNAASDVTLLKWQTVAQASIGVGTIVNSMIADNTIQDAKIVSLDYSKLSGTPSGLPPTGAAGGDLTGTYPNPSVGNAVITTAKINDSAVTTAKLADLNVTVGKLTPSGSALSLIRTNAGATANEYYVPPPFIVTDGATSLAGNGLKGLRVNTGATDIEAVTANGAAFGRILQQVTLQTLLPATSAAVHCAITATPAQTTGPTSTVLASLTSAAFTPLKAGSTIIVELYMAVASNGGSTTVIGALFQDATDAAVAAAPVQTPNNAVLENLHIRFTIASWGTGSSKVFKAGISSVSNTAYLNSIDGATTIFGGLGTPSWIRITEYI